MSDLHPTLCLPKIVHARRQAGGVAASYVDREYVFQFWEGGEIDFRFEDRIYRISAGMAALMPPHLPHALLAVHKDDQRCVVIHFVLPPESTLLRSFPMVAQFSTPAVVATKERLDVFLREWYERKPGYDLVVSGILVEVLGLFWRNRASALEPDSRASKAWRNIERVIPWIHRHFREQLSIDEMSTQAGLSPAYFCKAFKEYTGSSPHNYLNKVRIEKARQLLCHEDLNCTEVAARVGYPSVASFSRTFKKLASMSPSMWVRDYLPLANQK